MDFFIVSDQKKLVAKIDRLKSHIQILNPTDFRKTLKANQDNRVFYLDLACFQDNWEKEFKFSQKYENVFLALIDFQGKIRDVGALILKGIVDYLGKNNTIDELSSKHFSEVESYLEKFRRDYNLFDDEEEEEELDLEGYKIAEDGWASIQSGEEYTFYIMYVELDAKKELETSFAKSNLKLAIETFKKFVERNVSRFDGKIWIWQGFGGIVLFPFNGNDCPSALSGFRMAIYKHLHDAEESLFPHIVTYRMAIHLGNVLYRVENTGNVIADTLNSTFHLGSKYAEPGQFYITDEAYRFVHSKIKPFFVAAGEYEGRSIWRMRRPIFGGFKA